MVWCFDRLCEWSHVIKQISSYVCYIQDDDRKKSNTSTLPFHPDSHNREVGGPGLSGAFMVGGVDRGGGAGAGGGGLGW